jgi:hypothetical protein
MTFRDSAVVQLIGQRCAQHSSLRKQLLSCPAARREVDKRAGKHVHNRLETTNMRLTRSTFTLPLRTVI